MLSGFNPRSSASMPEVSGDPYSLRKAVLPAYSVIR